MMQRILGPIPTKMAERSNLKYFSKVVSSVYNIYNGIYNYICILPGQAAVGRGEHGRQTRAEEVQASDAVHPERGEGEEGDGVSRSCVLTCNYVARCEETRTGTKCSTW